MADGKHQLLLELGRGGMGTVYLAVSRGPAGFSKLKVVKRLRADLASDEGFLKMFLDEARLTARLNHPNVVQTNEVGFDGAHYFIEMEYLEGQSFDGLLRRSAKAAGLPRELSLYVLAQSLAGLHYAHELKDLGGQPLRIVHRDVSPHNVFVTYDGAVKVLDFGIAKAADSSSDTTTGVVKGKATYMAPEQAARRSVDRRADVFAVGVMLWEALTRKRLWAGLSDFEIFLALQKEPPPAPRTVDATIPEPLDAICRKALAFEPDERFATAKEMQLALEDVLATGGGRAGPGPLADRVCELFAERREAIAREIDARMKQIEAGGGEISARTSVDVPVLGMAKGVLETSTGPTRSRAGVVSGEATRAAVPSARKLPAAEGEGEEGEEKEGAAADSTRGEGGRARTKSAVISDVPPRPRTIARGPAVLVAASLVAALALAGFALRGRAPNAGGQAQTAAIPQGRDGGGAMACTSNKDCRSLGAPAICRKDGGRCVILTTPACRVLAETGDVENDDTIWFGSMFPTSAPEAEDIGKPYERGMTVAREDFAKMSHGIPRPEGIGAPRPLAIVACDDTNDPSAVAEHLVDVGVPAVVGFATSSEVIDLATRTFLPNHVLMIPTMDGSPLIGGIPNVAGDPRMVFRTTAELYAMSIPLATLVPQVLEPALRAKAGLRTNDALRVALVRFDSLTQISLAEDIVKALRFNGKSALENERAFDEVVLPKETDPVRNAELVDRLVKLAPHVILFTGHDELWRDLFGPLEARWTPKLKYRPVYVSDTDLEGPELLAWLKKAPEARARVYGMYGPLRTSANLRFTSRYNEGLPKPISYTATPSPSFDAFYLLAYAAFATGRDPITGPNLARSLEKLVPPGEPLDVGAAYILEAFGMLREGRRIDLGGAATNLNFDFRTGDVASDALLHCMRADGDSFASAELAIGYRASTGKWSGALACPP